MTLEDVLPLITTHTDDRIKVYDSCTDEVVTQKDATHSIDPYYYEYEVRLLAIGHDKAGAFIEIDLDMPLPFC